MRRPLQVRRGFTLVELLVVIGIIALLISILMPALSRVRAQSNAVKCATQMRDIGQALLMYAHENKGQIFPCGAKGIHLGGAFPEAERWPTLVFKKEHGVMNAETHYVPEIMKCPIDDRSVLDGPTAPQGGYHSYDLNAGLWPDQQQSYWPRYGARIPGFSSSDVVIMVDKYQNRSEWHIDLPGFPNVDTTGTKNQWYALIFNTDASNITKKRYKHGKSGSNFLFFDFSVRNDEPVYRMPFQHAPHQYIPGNNMGTLVAGEKYN